MKTWMAVWLLLPVVVLEETNETKVVFAPKWKLEYLSVEKVNFRDTDPREVIKYLQKQSGKLSPDKEEINIVWLIPKEEKLPRITLNLANIPLEEALKYTVRAAKLRYRVESHAVVIFRPEPPPAGGNAPAQ